MFLTGNPLVVQQDLKMLFIVASVRIFGKCVIPMYLSETRICLVT